MFLVNDSTPWNVNMTEYEVNMTAYEGNGTTVVEYNRDRNALVYIVVVLSFYSLGIAAAMITYLRRERVEMEEEKAYGDYFTFRNRSDTLKRYFQVQRTMDTLNDRGPERIDKHVKKSKSAEMIDMPMRVLHPSKTDHQVLNDTDGEDDVFPEVHVDTLALERSKTQKKLSRVWEESSVFQAATAND